MASNKSKAKKMRLGKAGKESKPAPLWAILKVFGKRGHRWRLNPHKRRNWRSKKIKA